MIIQNSVRVLGNACQFATDLLKCLSSAACHRTAGYASGGVTKDKEPLKKAKTPQGRFDMDETESKSKDVLERKNTRHFSHTVLCYYLCNELHKRTEVIYRKDIHMNQRPE